MDRFLRPISVVALLQELVIFGGLIVTLTFLKAHERFESSMNWEPRASRFLTNWWGLLALIPLAWVFYAMFDEDSEEPRLGERVHFWTGVGLLVLLAWFVVSASIEALAGPPFTIKQAW